jgi:hypothetical protein
MYPLDIPVGLFSFIFAILLKKSYSYPCMVGVETLHTKLNLEKLHEEAAMSHKEFLIFYPCTPTNGSKIKHYAVQ